MADFVGGPLREAVLELEHVTLSYESGVQALSDVTLRVAEGEHLCVLGANGSGKSTLASVICGLLAPDTGRVELAGQRVFDGTRDEPIDFEAYRRARRELGLVFQNPDDQIVTTVVEEDVAFGPENLGIDPAEIGQRVQRELKRVALEEFAQADPTKMSGGQKQRVAIAGALAMEPEVLVFDEPGSLLDVRGRAAIMRVMGRLRGAGTTIVHITHFMEEALAADRVVVLEKGRIVLEGTPREVFSHAEKIQALGLEEPFVAQLSGRLRELGLPVDWTCDEDELVGALAGLATELADASGAALSCNDEPEEQADSCGVAGDSVADSVPVLAVRDVSFSYDRRRKALDGVSFEVTRGASVALVGHTGSGKSTLLRLLCALDAPDSGNIVVGGVDTARKRDRRRLHGTIGYVMQHPERQLFAETVIEDVAFGPHNLGLSDQEVEERCRAALRLVGLAGLEGVSPFELSGGQQRLCAIAGVLAMNPSMLVLDEPTAGLDPRGRRQLRRILADVAARGTTLVEVTHNMDDAALSQEVVVLNEGRVMLKGTPREVFCPEQTEFLGDAGLGLPHALDWALRMGEFGLPVHRDVLALDDLAAEVARVCGGRCGHGA